MRSVAVLLLLLMLPATARATTVLGLLPQTTITRLDQDTWRFEMHIYYAGWEYLTPGVDYGYPVYGIPAIDALAISGGFGVPFDPEFNYPGTIYLDPDQIVESSGSWRGNGISYAAFSFTPSSEALSGDQYWSVDAYGTMWWGLIWDGPDSWSPVQSLHGTATIYGSLPTAIGASTTWSVTPEPASCWLLVAGLTGMGAGAAYNRRRRAVGRGRNAA